MERVRMTPARWVLLVVGGLMVIGLVTLSTLNLVSWLGRTTEVSHATYRPTGDRLALSTTSGDVHLVGDNGETVRVTTTLKYGLWKPTVQTSSGPDGLQLDSHCRTIAGFCSVDYQIALPRSLTVQLHTDSGDVHLAGITGRVDLSSSSGDVILTDLSGAAVSGSTSSGDIRITNVTSSQLTVRTRSGDIHGSGLTNRQIDAKTGSGDIRMTVTTAPDLVTARTGSGNINLTVPQADDGYRVTTTTGSGDTHIRVIRNDTSDRALDLHTGSGDIQVTPAAS